MRFNVKDFAPSEISVKAEGKKVLVTAKHEEQKESGKTPRLTVTSLMTIPLRIVFMSKDLFPSFD